MPSLSLHLVTWNGAKYLPHLFASLREQTLQEWGLVVVDNGSRDSTVAVLEQELSHFRTKLRKEIRVVRNVENTGFAGGHNQAFQCRMQNAECRTDGYIQLLNQDTVLAPDYLATLVQFLDAHSDVAAVQGALCRWDFARDERTDTIDTLGLRVLRTRKVVELSAGEPQRSTRTQRTQKWTTVQNCVHSLDGALEVFGVSGALPMYRWNALLDVALSRATPSLISPSKMEGEKTGSAPPSVSVQHPRYPLSDPMEIFDSSFFSYKEDVDLAYRLRAAGWKAYCVPGARAWHDRSAGVHRTRAERSAFERRLSWRNHLLTLLANEHSRTFARDWWRILGYELGKLAYIVIREPLTLAAIPSFLRLLPRAFRKRRAVTGKYRVAPEEMGRWFR